MGYFPLVPSYTSSGGAGLAEEAAHELYKIGTEVTSIHLALSIVFGFIVLFGLFSGFIKERLYVGEAILATVFGIICSDYAAGIFAPRTWGEASNFNVVTLELSRVVIALSVFAVGVELPKAYVLRHWRSLAVLLGPTMIVGWLVSGGLICAIIPGLDFLPALVIAAGLSPTDPILAASVVGKGKFAQEHVPAHIRHILQAESGSNDGAAFPFLYLALFLLLRGEKSLGSTIGEWIVLVILYQIVLGVVIGATVGIVVRKLLKFSKRRKLIDRESLVAMYIALALLVTGLTTLCGSDDLLAAFACGTAFAWDDWFSESIEDSNFSSIIDLVSNSAIFIYLGATMPFATWNDPLLTLTPWRLVLLALSILALRRIPAIYALQKLIPDIKTRREALFCGHFGPMGIGALFISTLAVSKLPTPNVPPETSLDVLALTIQPITYFVILSSVLVHGLTIGFFSLGRRVHSRVQSISRTFTQASMGGDIEPSWMSRVKRVATGEDIVINRDDDEKVDLAEKGSNDSGKLAMFAAPPSRDSFGPTGSGSGSYSSKGEGKNDDPEKGSSEHQRENDDHPAENILSSSPKERDHHVGRELPSHQDEHHIIVNHEDDSGAIHIEDLHPSHAALDDARSHPHKTILPLSKTAVEPEGAVKKLVGKVTARRASIMNAIKKDDGLTPEERAIKKQAKLDSEADIRKEQNFCERQKVLNPPKRAAPVARQWIEGSKVVTEYDDGENVTVRLAEPSERSESALDGVRAELSKLAKVTKISSNEPIARRGKERAVEGEGEEAEARNSSSQDRGLGLTLTRTIRLDDDSPTEEADWVDESISKPPPTTLPSRPTPRRGSTMQSMRELIFRRNRSPDKGASINKPSISFAAAPTPSRPRSIIAPRKIPAIGSINSGLTSKKPDLRMSRTSTQGSIRFVEDHHM